MENIFIFTSETLETSEKNKFSQFLQSRQLSLLHVDISGVKMSGQELSHVAVAYHEQPGKQSEFREIL